MIVHVRAIKEGFGPQIKVDKKGRIMGGLGPDKRPGICIVTLRVADRHEDLTDRFAMFTEFGSHPEKYQIGPRLITWRGALQ